jgi:hypothetical protein
MIRQEHTDDHDDAPHDSDRSTPAHVALLAVEDAASEWEDGVFAESIIRSRSHLYHANTSGSGPALSRSISVQTHGSPSGPGAYAIPGMSSTPPSPAAIRRAVTTAPPNGSTTNATDFEHLEQVDRIPYNGATSDTEAVSPTPRLPKYVLRDGPSSLINSIAPPDLTFSVTSISGSMIAPVAEEEPDEAVTVEEDYGPPPSNSDWHSPEMFAASVPEAPLSNFPPIEAFSAPVESELFPVAVPFTEEDPKPIRCGWIKKPWIWIVLVTTVCITVVATVVGVCANGACTQGTTSFPPLAVNYRDLALYDYINHISFAMTKPIAYVNQSHPEEKALHWIVTEDPLRLSAPQDLLRIRQRYALLTLWYYNMPSNPWVNMTGWLDSEDECTWAGILCDNETNVVTGLELTGTGIDGGIPPDLALLTDLQVLAFYCIKNTAYWYSCLSGTVPPSLASLPRIQSLVFDSNNLTGPVSMWLGSWSDLETIDISLNNFTGTLPADAMSSWTNLLLLDFSLNQLSGALPDDAMAHWIALNGINLAWNFLSGTLPEAIGAWTNLTFIDISSNEFVGTIPLGIETNWTHLYEAIFFPNNFTGLIPNVSCTIFGSDTPEVCNTNATFV